MGANRIGFGTLAMVSLGCTICRGCQLDTCHVGIATQIETIEEAAEHGLKKFTPQQVAERGRELRPLLLGDGRGGARADRRARLRAHPGPRRPLRPARAGRRTTEALDLSRADHARSRSSSTSSRSTCRWPTGAGGGPRRGRPGRGAPDPDGAEAASAEIAGLADEVCIGGGGVRRSSRARPTPTTGCSAPSLSGAIARARIYDGVPPSRAKTCSPSSSSTAARSRGRASARSTPRA